MRVSIFLFFIIFRVFFKGVWIYSFETAENQCYGSLYTQKKKKENTKRDFVGFWSLFNFFFFNSKRLNLKFINNT